MTVYVVWDQENLVIWSVHRTHAGAKNKISELTGRTDEQSTVAEDFIVEEYNLDE